MLRRALTSTFALCGLLASPFAPAADTAGAPVKLTHVAGPFAADPPILYDTPEPNQRQPHSNVPIAHFGGIQR